jgi:hypothetical protein
MKTITYNNKQYKLPFDVELPEDPTAEVEVANRFSGEKTTMPEFAAAVYDTGPNGPGVPNKSQI